MTLTYAEEAFNLWMCLHPWDEETLSVAFYKVDKGWYRLSPRPGVFYDFYAKRVGEGSKKETNAGIESSKAMIVVGLENAVDPFSAFGLCTWAVESTKVS
jgi:hypothetical protein